MTVDARPYAPDSPSPRAAASAASPRTRGAVRLAERLVGLEPWLALPCALLLLAYPNPLVIPAGLVGALPSLARLVSTGRPWRPTAFDLPIALLVVGALLGALASLNRDAATIRLTGLLAGLILFAAARQHVRTERQSRALVLALLAIATLAVLGLLIVVAPFLLLDHVPPLASLVRALDQWEIGRRPANEDWLLQRYRFRASGVGALAVVGLALVTATLVGTRSRRSWPLLGLPALFFLGALVTTDNRGSMVAAVLVLGGVAAAWRRRFLLLLPVGAAILGVALALGVVERGLSPRTVGQRFWFWENAVYLARELPFTGAGLGLDSARLTYQAYFQPVYPPFSHAHNIYLQGLLEQGVVGLAGLVGLGIATLWLGWRSNRAPERWGMAARLASFGVALTLLVAGLSEIAALSTFGSALLLAAAGLLAATATVTPDVGTDARSGYIRPALAAGRRRGIGAGLRARPVLLALGLVIVVLVLALVGGRRLATVALLNAGTVELNRGTISEWVGKSERTDALDRAVRLLRTAADVDPSDLTVQRNLAMALAATNDERGARAAADRARGLVDPAAATAVQDQFQVGRAYAAFNSWGETIRAWQAAGAGAQLVQLGNRLIRTRSYDQATNAYIAAANVQPRTAAAYEGVARAARERGANPDEVIRALQPLVARGGDFEYMARIEIGRTYREAGRLREAFAALRDAERIGSSPELSYELGATAARMEHWHNVHLYLERAADDLPLRWESWYLLAYSLLRQARPADALAIVDRGFERASFDRRTDRVPLLTVRGESLLALGRPAEARAAFEEGLSIRQNDARLREGVERAHAAIAGAPANLVTNPNFAWDGGWIARPATEWDGATPFGDERARIVDGALKVDGREQPGRLVMQQIWGLEPGASYRLTVRARSDGAAPSAATVSVWGPPQRPSVTATLTEEWTTLDLQVQASHSDVILTLGLGPDTPSGAVIFDDISLVRESPAR